MINFFKNNKLFITCFIVFILLTFSNMITHRPCSDEAQNYMVSYFMNFSNWTELSSSHGHPILWYLFMMPFSKLNIGYPYSILILNYIFILSALIIMWKKAPFDNVYKVIITFSYMMISYYSIVARCYSLGILCLFLVALMYKQQKEKPILYSILLGLAANTSAIAAIAVIPLSLIFIYKLCLNTREIGLKKLFFSISILFVFAFLFMAPFIQTSIYRYSPDETNFFLLSVKNFFFSMKHSLIFIFSYFFVLFYLIFNSKNKESKFFLISSTLIFWLFMFFVYKCFPYHRFFFFIFIIIAMWIQNYFEKYKKSLIFIIALIIILYTPYNLKPWIGQEYIYNFGNTLKNSKHMYNDTIVVVPDYYLRYEIAPFLLLNNPEVKIFGCKSYYDYRFRDGENCDYKASVDYLIQTSDKPIYLFSNKELEDYKLIEKNNKINIYKLK